MIDSRTGDSLLQAAKSASMHSYSPYSHFRVGAALLCEDGTIVTGTNVENRSYGLTICAERSAVACAVATGRREFRALALYCPDSEDAVPPCGACRQVLADLAGDIDCILVDARGRRRSFRLSELFPHPFGDQLFLHRPPHTHDDPNAS